MRQLSVCGRDAESVCTRAYALAHANGNTAHFTAQDLEIQRLSPQQKVLRGLLGREPPGRRGIFVVVFVVVVVVVVAAAAAAAVVVDVAAVVLLLRWSLWSSWSWWSFCGAPAL